MTPIEILNSMDRRFKRAKYPTVPDNALQIVLYSQKDANSITRSILRFLQLKNHYCSRIQSQGQYNPILKRWTTSTVRKGIGDITATIHGRYVMIEVKAGKDRMSKHQEQTKQEVEASGGLYYIARSFDDFYAWYQSITKC